MWYNINRNGQLGNRLFSRAHVYAAAKELGETVVDWGLMDVAKHFPNVSQSPIPTYPLLDDGSSPDLPQSFLASERVLELMHKLRPRTTGQFGNMWCQTWGKGDPEPYRFDSDAFKEFNARYETKILSGFKFRCVDWVRKHSDDIRKYFEPHQSLMTKWQVTRECWHERFDRVIGIHIRLSDFRTAASGKYFVPPEGYAKIIRERVEFDPQTTLFVVCTDESFRDAARYAEFEKSFEGLNVFINQGDLMDDLVGLMHCDQLVGAGNSTFSRWAAFAGNVEWAGFRSSMIDDDHSGEIEFN